MDIAIPSGTTLQVDGWARKNVTPSEERQSTGQPSQIRLDLTQAHHIPARDGTRRLSLGLQSTGATTRRCREGPNTADGAPWSSIAIRQQATNARSRHLPPQLLVPATNAAEHRRGRDKERPVRRVQHLVLPLYIAIDIHEF
jgi:hypothetical protein